jgi:hypothetical protein
VCILVLVNIVNDCYSDVIVWACFVFHFLIHVRIKYMIFLVEAICFISSKQLIHPVLLMYEFTMNELCLKKL